MHSTKLLFDELVIRPKLSTKCRSRRSVVRRSVAHRVFDANFSYFTSKPYAETPHRDGSVEGLQHIFYAELTKIIPNCHQILPLILSSAL